MCYEDEFYYEPSEFDQQVEEFKASLMKSVKEDFLQRMEDLKKENAALRKFRDEKETFIRDYEARIAAAQRESRMAEEKWKNARLHQLLGDFLTDGWRAGYTFEQGPKCNNCDEHRNLHFRSPMGRELKEECDCAKRFIVYRPEKVVLSKLYVKKKHPLAGVDYNWWGRYYTVEDKGDDDKYEMQAEVYEAGFRDFKKVKNKYWAVFLDEEDCKKFCDWLNEQESAKED